MQLAFGGGAAVHAESVPVLGGEARQGDFCSATQYIGENYSQKITLEGLAKMVYLSPAYLSRVFKQETGMNFNEYLNRVRIQKAQELPAHPGDPDDGHLPDGGL